LGVFAVEAHGGIGGPDGVVEGLEGGDVGA